MEENLESIKREAYTKALKFKNTGMEEEVIFVRLEKQGVPFDIAKEVAKNVFIKMKEDKENKLPENVNTYTVWQKLLKAMFK
jgi:hypothetical protein